MMTTSKIVIKFFLLFAGHGLAGARSIVPRSIRQCPVTPPPASGSNCAYIVGIKTPRRGPTLLWLWPSGRDERGVYCVGVSPVSCCGGTRARRVGAIAARDTLHTPLLNTPAHGPAQPGAAPTPRQPQRCPPLPDALHVLVHQS